MEDIKNILDEAKKCLNCKNPMCRKGCPVNTNIPEFINNIKEEKYKEAYKILQENNILSEICSLICPTENQCMGNCIKGIKGTAVNISKLEQFVNKWAKENNIIENTIKLKLPNNIKIAVIGAGPAGIACSVELIKKGYDVTIFEQKDRVGGILEYEIPDFRLSKGKIKPIYEKLRKLGIKFKFKTVFGKDITINSLKKEGYKSIFLGLGANISSTYKLLEDNNNNILFAKEILERYYKKEKNQNLGKTIVIGGGNVAIDAARVSKKLGAEEVTIVYRRSREKMPATQKELREALEDGVKFLFNTKVVKAYIDSKSKLTDIKCIKTITSGDKIEDIENSDFKIAVDTIIFAIGLKIEEAFLNSIGIDTEDGLVKVNENGMTSLESVFAGGDLVEKKQTACKAIASGKKAADGIDKYLMNNE